MVKDLIIKNNKFGSNDANNHESNEVDKSDEKKYKDIFTKIEQCSAKELVGLLNDTLCIKRNKLVKTEVDVDEDKKAKRMLFFCRSTEIEEIVELKEESKDGKSEEETSGVVVPFGAKEVHETSIRVPFHYYFNVKNPNVVSFPNTKLNFQPINPDLVFEGKCTEDQERIFPEIHSFLEKKRCVLLNLPTGSGKTFCAILISFLLKNKTLIVCHRTNIMDQWVDSISRFIPLAKILILKTGMEVPDDVDFCIINITILKRFKINNPRFGMLIVDEFHAIASEQSAIALLKIKPLYFIGLTATPYNAAGKENEVIELFVGYENMVEVSFNADFNVFIAKSQFWPSMTKMNIKIEVIDIRGNSHWEEKELLDWNFLISEQSEDEHRNLLILDIVKHIHSLGDRNILVLCKRKQQVRYLYDNIRTFCDKVDFFTGSKKNFDQNCEILVASYQKAGTGFNFIKLNCLVLATDILEQTTQSLGRVFRVKNPIFKPIIIDIYDNANSCAALEKHYEKRIEVYRKSGGKIININSIEEITQH